MKLRLQNLPIKTDQQIKEEEKAAKERLKIQQAFQQSSIDAMDEGYAKACSISFLIFRKDRCSKRLFKGGDRNS